MSSEASAAPFNFIVAIRHPATVADLDGQQAALADLFRSLDAQTDRRFAVLVACNADQVLPPEAGHVRRVHVDLPPARLGETQTLEELSVAFRNDKGRRVRAAVDLVPPDALVMAVDDDDLVSRRLVAFVLSRPPAGWYVDEGFAWATGAAELLPMIGFHRLCGSSIIAPARYFKHVSGRGTEDEAIQELGSHRIIIDEAGESGNVFHPLPFRGAIYRRGHANATQTDVDRIAAARPAAPPGPGARALEAMRRLKASVFPRPRTATSGPRIFVDRPVRLDPALRREFFGDPDAASTRTEGTAWPHPART